MGGRRLEYNTNLFSRGRIKPHADAITPLFLKASYLIRMAVFSLCGYRVCRHQRDHLNSTVAGKGKRGETEAEKKRNKKITSSAASIRSASERQSGP